MDFSQLSAFLERLADALDDDRVVVSDKAAGEAAQDFGWDLADIIEELRELQIDDYLRSEPSRRRAGDTVHTFTPPLDDGELWIRLVERDGFIVVSFHRA